MVQAYNFLASWQLFPEKCDFEYGLAPKSGNCRIESSQDGEGLTVSINWVNLENDAFYSEYEIIPDGKVHPFPNTGIADEIKGEFSAASVMEFQFLKNGNPSITVKHEILPNGYLKVTHCGTTPEAKPFTNIEVYHKQMSVLPYASSVGSVAIRPDKEGMIKHKALSAMEEQTNMQLDQIREQIELLARQAQEIKKRKELSMMIYEASLRFKPQIGHVYHLYENKDGSHTLSLVGPDEWGRSRPFKHFVASVKLLADHTWVELT